MRIDRGFFGWGVFFIALGAVPLAVDAGWVSASAVSDLWRLWPLILVGIGVGLILARSQLALIGTLITSLTIGLALGGLFAGAGVSGFPLVGCGSGEQPGGPTSGTLAGTASVSLDWACGDLHVADQAGSGWQLSATGQAGQTAVTASETNLAVKAAGTFSLASGGARSLAVTLPADPTLDLRVNQAFGDGTITLAGSHLSSLQAKVAFGTGDVDVRGATLKGTLDLTFDFGSGNVALPLGTYSGTMHSSFGSLNACVPAGLGVRLTASSSFGSFNPGPEFTQTGGTWQTADYTTAANKADLTVTSSFGSFNISRCD